jgi:hypothetical protein
MSATTIYKGLSIISIDDNVTGIANTAVVGRKC